ncbi:MAG: hypothetical protein II938_02960 [Alphaproteobacteria bacterium]|nr:hypothetical protein [Alphaproteobacteria bacterium]
MAKLSKKIGEQLSKEHREIEKKIDLLGTQLTTEIKKARRMGFLNGALAMTVIGLILRLSSMMDDAQQNNTRGAADKVGQKLEIKAGDIGDSIGPQIVGAADDLMDEVHAVTRTAEDRYSPRDDVMNSGFKTDGFVGPENVGISAADNVKQEEVKALTGAPKMDLTLNGRKLTVEGTQLLPFQTGNYTGYQLKRGEDSLYHVENGNETVYLITEEGKGVMWQFVDGKLARKRAEMTPDGSTVIVDETGVVVMSPEGVGQHLPEEQAQEYLKATKPFDCKSFPEVSKFLEGTSKTASRSFDISDRLRDSRDFD